MSAIYAGVQLCQTTPEVREWVERNIPMGEFTEFNWHSAPPAIFDGLTYWPHNEAAVAPRLNVLRWPSGAGRWATYHFLATDEQLVTIRTAVYGDAEAEDPIASNPQPFKLYDATNELITVDEMWMLAPRPISATPLHMTGRNRLWLCTLVDIRYFWNQDHCGAIAEEDAGTWDTMFEVLRGRTGLAPEYWDCPDVASVWLFPHTDLQEINSLPLGLVIDAMAWNVGRKVSLDMDGTVHIEDYSWHLTRMGANLVNEAWYRLAGDVFELAVRDASSIIPEKIRMTFADGDEARDHEDVDVNTIVGWESENGKGTIVFHNRMDVADSSDAQRTALLLAVATAWLGFQTKATPDISYAGLVKWLPEAMTDFIEWHELLDEGSDLVPDPADGKVRVRKQLNSIARTRVVRPPLNLVVDDLWHGGSGGGSGSGAGAGGGGDAGLTITCPDGSVHRVRISGNEILVVEE